MIKESGYIVYCLNNDSKQITKELDSIEHFGLDGAHIYLKDTTEYPTSFIYKDSTKNWFAPYQDKYGSWSWKKFKGNVKSFEFRTYFEGD